MQATNTGPKSPPKKITGVKQLENLEEHGKWDAGNGLRLVVDKNGKRWVFRYQINNKRREMGLGSYPDVGLKAARTLRDTLRVEIGQGIDPLEQREAKKKELQAAKAKEVTFQQCATDYIAAHRAGWKNVKHAQQWENTLSTYAYPLIGEKVVGGIDSDDVLSVLTPIWQAKPETAARVRNRIELVLDAARAKGLRQGENPARWRGYMDKLLPPRSKVKAVRNHPAMPIDEVAAFMKRLNCLTGSASKALQMTILTACRTSEVLNATWEEFDMQKRTWTIPKERMKAQKEHRVPLPQAAVELLEGQLGKDDKWVFPGRKEGKPLSNMAMLKIMRDMGKGHYVPHGFRSTFRDWASERTSFTRDVCEMALAHTIGNDVEAAYRRGDLFEKRRELMESWGAFAAPLAEASSQAVATSQVPSSISE